MDKPHGNMSEAQLIALHANPDRHPNALGYELKRCAMSVLVNLAYDQYAPEPCGAPDGLAELAYDEMERRQAAAYRLRGALGVMAL